MIENNEQLCACYQKYRRRLLRAAYSYIPQRECSEDLVADVIVALLRLQPRFSGEGACVVYMLKIVRSCAVDLLRAGYDRTFLHAEEIDRLAEVLCARESGFQEVETALYLDALLENEPPEFQAAYRAHILDSVPIRVLANRMGLSSDTLRMRFHRFHVRARQSAVKDVPVAAVAASAGQKYRRQDLPPAEFQKAWLPNR